MEDVLAKAADLGRAIRDTEKFQALRDAEAAVMANPDSITLAEALGTLHRQRAQEQVNGKDMDAATAEKIEKITAAVALDERLQTLSRAQQEFQEVINRVNETMLGQLKPGDPA